MSLTARAGASVEQASATPLPLVVAGAVAGVAAAALSFGVFAVIALAAWMLDPGGSQEWAQMLEAAAAAWLAGLGLAPTIGGISLSLLPVGFAGVALVAIIAAARWASDASAVGGRGEALVVGLAAAVGFGVVAAVVAGLARHLEVPPLHAALWGAGVALITGFLAVGFRSRSLSLAHLPATARDIVAAAIAAVLVLVIAAGVVLGTAIIMQFDELTVLLVELDAGLSGALLLVILSLGYLPVALTWTVSYLLGAGVSLGGDGMVSPFADPVAVTLPGFPLFAVLPDHSTTTMMIMPLVGAIAGILAGALLRRRGHCGLRDGVPLALGAALVAGVIIALAAQLATGSMGTTKLVDLGPSPLVIGPLAAGLIALGALAVVAWPPRSARG